MVKVKNVLINTPFHWRTEADGSHVLTCTAAVDIDYMHNGVQCVAKVRFFGEPSDGHGFRCDGLSVPKIFRWFLPSWDEKNALYNVAGSLHDWLYSTGGNYGDFTRGECDDFFRGLLRESGIGRFKAGCADKAVEWFAGGKSHWKNDGYGVAKFAMMEIRRCSR